MGTLHLIEGTQAPEKETVVRKRAKILEQGVRMNRSKASEEDEDTQRKSQYERGWFIEYSSVTFGDRLKFHTMATFSYEINASSHLETLK